MAKTVHEIILSYMKLSGNSKQQGYAQLREAADLSWYKLFKSTKESIQRKWVPVTKGIAMYPSSAEKILGLYTLDHCDDLRPLYEDNIKSTLPMPTDKCSCNAQDHAECLCPVITESEGSLVEVIIQGQTYTNKYFTRVMKGGNIIEEKYEWVPSHNAAGAFIEAVEVASQKTICSLEVNSCGCPANTEENIKLLCGCACFDSQCAPYIRERYPAFYNEFGYYKKDDVNRRVFVFDSNGKKSTLKYVEIKYQSNGEDMLVPDYAMLALIALLNWTKILYSPMFSPVDKNEAKKNFNREKTEMLRYIHPINFERAMQGYPALPVGKKPVSNYPLLNYSSHAPAPVVTAENCGLTSEVKELFSVIRQYITNVNITNQNTSNYVTLKATVDGIAGSPVEGLYTWQSNALKGSSGIEFILVNKNIEDIVADFTIDPVTGILTRTNPWQPLDSLIVPLYKRV